VALIACASTVHAESDIAIEATSDYDYRGESQTREHPAVQMNFEYSDPGLWKTGLFMSNVDFGNTCGCGNPRLEVNPFVELTHKTDLGVVFGAGANYYAYTIDGGGSYDYAELNVDATFDGVQAWLSYAPDYDGHAVPLSRGAWYASMDGATVLYKELSLTGHVGLAWGPYWIRLGGGSKVDFSIGLKYPVRGFDILLQYVDSRRTEPEPGAERLVGRTILSVQTAISL
jgi:uncharacterized protein (TIGR02001 family)